MKKVHLVLFSLALSFSSSAILAEGSIKQEQAAKQNAMVQFTQAELEQMLAPIALYPDSVLTHILIASTYPLEIIQADRWASKNPDMEPADALEKVENEEWDPSVKALIPFPRILERLSDDLDWTQRLGDAFLQSEERVLDSIQSLRQKADEAGNLSQMDNMEITREDDNIIIQPLEREVVYVPYYDTRVVYGNWRWAHYQPVYWDWSWHSHHNHYNYHYRPHYGLFSWHPSIHLSTHFFFSAFNWHNHHVVVVDRHHYNSRRYRHRSHIIAHNNARRWSHNPTHRRGVAYRSNQVRERYNSNRPSVNATRLVRNNERHAATSRQINTARSRVTTSGSDRAVTTRKPTNTKPVISRQERLREKLNTNRVTQTKPREISSNNRNADRSSNRVQSTIKQNSRIRSNSTESYIRNENSNSNNTVRSNRTQKPQVNRNTTPPIRQTKEIYKPRKESKSSRNNKVRSSESRSSKKSDSSSNSKSSRSSKRGDRRR